MNAAGGRPSPGHTLVAGGMRFGTELIAWILTPWALWQWSVPLAIFSVVALIGLPAIFGTPGDRPRGDSPVPVSGIVTISLVLLQLAAAAASAWVLLPGIIAIVITALCAVTVVTEQPRWRSLIRTTRETRVPPRRPPRR